MAKLSINKIEKVMKEMFVPETTVDWHGEQITVKRVLSLEDMLTFTNIVIDSCFDDGEYIPQLKDFATRVATLICYVDINLPEDSERKYAICYKTDLVKTVMGHIDLSQYSEMLNAIEYKLDNMAESNTQMAFKKVDEASEAITKIVNEFNAIFENIDSQDLRNVISAIGSGGIDEQKIVDAYINAQKEKVE